MSQKTLQIRIPQRRVASAKPVVVTLYGIIWRDACHSFNPDKENTELAWALDVGFGVAAHDDRIVLGRQMFDDGDVRHAMSIPNGCLRKLIPVGEIVLPSVFTSEPKIT